MPYISTFNAPMPGTLNDINGQGTGFTTVNNYSGVRLSADGSVSNQFVPGYEPSKILITGGQLQITSSKGIDYLTNNNQLNTLGVKISTGGKFQIEVKVINPYYGTQSQQAGIWFGFNDKTYIKLGITGNKVELRKELNDLSSTVAGTANPDQRVTPVINNLQTQTVWLRLIIDSASKTAEGFYSTNGTNYNSTGATYATSSVNITSMGITDSTAYAGVFATYRNGPTPINYKFDDFKVSNISQTSQYALSFSVDKLDFTALQGSPVLSQTVVVRGDPVRPPYTLSKSSASWLQLPSGQTDSLKFGPQNINTNLAAGNYQALVTCKSPGYTDATLLINLNIVDSIPDRAVRINFQDKATVPPVAYVRDYGQAYGPRTGLYQASELTYGWKRKSDNSLLSLTANGRNRNTPEDILFATLMHMQANNISGSFTGTKIEGYWELSVPNGVYDATVAVGDGLVNSSPERHTINIEGVNAISNFIPVGNVGTNTRFKSATIRVTVADERLTIDATGGQNTKINYAAVVPVSTAPYLYWSTSTQNIIIKKGSTQVNTFLVKLGNSKNLTSSYSLKASYAAGATGWLSFNSTYSGIQPQITVNYSGAKNLAVGIYKATITATSSQYTSAKLAVQINVVDSLRPYVISSTPLNGAKKVSINTVSIAANNLHVPVVSGTTGGVDNSTITSTTVKLMKLIDTTYTQVSGVVQGTGGGDAISFSPSSNLAPATIYKFMVTAGVKSYSGAAFSPYEATFTTDEAKIDTSGFLNAQFAKVPIPGTQNIKYSTLKIGPDDKLYALRLDGIIERFNINHADGTLSNKFTINTLFNKYGARSAIGLVFDPQSTASNLIVWVSHCSGGLTTAPEFDGNISRLNGNNLQMEQLMVTKLPRSTRDHLVNSLAFGPDNALYICQGSNSSAGSYDNDWQRSESLLSGTVLRLDVQKLNAFTLPLNVKTTTSQSIINNAPSNSATMSDGTYNPYASTSPITIYASGVRNAYDLVWHSNGQLYLPTNGSGGGGNSPASVAGTRKVNGTFYNGPVIPATTGVKVQVDWLFRVNPSKPVGFYGHPNPLRGEYVINRGFQDNPLYAPNIVPDNNFRPGYDFGLNHSPNGALEYKSNTFNGVLKGKLLVCRFSGGGDIVVMEPGSMVKRTDIGSDDHIYDIVKVVSGSSNSGLIGMSGFINPLDIVEDETNGNLYVIEFNWNDIPSASSQITLLRVQSQPSPPLAMLAVSATAEPANDSRKKKYIITLANRGDGVLRVKDISLTGEDATGFKIADIKLPTTKSPLILKRNSAISFKVNAAQSNAKSISTKLIVTSMDDVTGEADLSNKPEIESIESKADNEIITAKNLSKEQRKLIVYPNPNASTGTPLNIQLKNFNKHENTILTVYDMRGNTLKTMQAPISDDGEFNTQILMSDPGMNTFYVVRATYLSGSISSKIILIR
ncbi:Ig-like domain-containing protein [Mucilaginibacter sp.]|uniref:Ig-like domain-containing protein n=1 Tax=Mucilaginibacter sp. TaxID=1882438 RepID=UPI003563C9FA